MCKLMYVENGIEMKLGSILTNHSMSVEDALQSLNIDMDEIAKENDWDDWNYEALKLVYDAE